MSGDRELLEHHTLVVRDGRIAAVLPHAAAQRYSPQVTLDRPTHLLMPGLVDAYAGAHAGTGADLRYRREIGLSRIASLLQSGVTCFCAVGDFPGDIARESSSQGIRTVVGLPVAEAPGAWAQNAADYLTKALRLRDDYKAHPLISTRFSPLDIASLGDASLARMGTLADELDAGITVSLHPSRRQVDDSTSRFGMRPLARLESFGLLTPALTAVHMAHADEADVDVARRGGIGVTLCLASGLLSGDGMPPLAVLESAKMRVGLGADAAQRGGASDLWTEIKLLMLHSRRCAPWDAIAAATRGGAAVLGLEGEIGTLEPGKWADLCCIDLGGPATLPVYDPLRQAVLAGGRDLVSDAWVAGRQLLSGGRFTRLDWPELARKLSETYQ